MIFTYLFIHNTCPQGMKYCRTYITNGITKSRHDNKFTIYPPDQQGNNYKIQIEFEHLKQIIKQPLYKIIEFIETYIKLKPRK